MCLGRPTFAGGRLELYINFRSLPACHGNTCIYALISAYAWRSQPHGSPRLNRCIAWGVAAPKEHVSPWDSQALKSKSHLDSRAFQTDSYLRLLLGNCSKDARSIYCSQKQFESPHDYCGEMFSVRSSREVTSALILVARGPALKVPKPSNTMKVDRRKTTRCLKHECRAGSQRCDH